MTGQIEAADSRCNEALLSPIRELISRYPGVSFLTLGQTVFWDEPVKAIVRRAMNVLSPDTLMTLAVHDTDYFARPHAILARNTPYTIVAHNGGSTRDLWSAAGEISSLFGSETVPRKSDLLKFGVRLDVAAQATKESKTDLMDQMTTAWGWRGIVHTSGTQILTCEVTLNNVLNTLLELIDWAFDCSIAHLSRDSEITTARSMHQQIHSLVSKEAASMPAGTLSDLYQSLFPRMHAILMGDDPRNIRVSHSIAESLFTPETANRPRFHIVDLFLKSESRDICIAAYNAAVGGSEIYTLDQFGEGAIPFDLVTTTEGRGSLRIMDDGIHVEGRHPVFIPTPSRVEEIGELARVINDYYGGPVNLVGKAVTWIAMLGAEYIFVFNEGASSYTHRTRSMVEQIRNAGFDLQLMPILRMKYNAWDALQNIQTLFHLPEHLSAAFGQKEISAQDFASNWRQVMNRQADLLDQFGGIHKPLDLLQFLAHKDPSRWQTLLEDYQSARDLLRQVNAPTSENRSRLIQLREQHYHKGIQLDQLHRNLGHLRKAYSNAPADQRVILDQQRSSIHEQITELRLQRADIITARHLIKKNLIHRRSTPEYLSALETLRRIEAQAELQRLSIVSQVFQAYHSLECNNRRPTAWWIPLISPDGAWFEAICHSTTAYIEPL